METRRSPKHLQKENRYEEALEVYRSRYMESLREEDRYLSSMYLNEIAQTIILRQGEKCSYNTLRKILESVVSQDEVRKSDLAEIVEEDIEIVMRKRFTKKEVEKHLEEKARKK